jgi:hypothetical protein
VRTDIFLQAAKAGQHTAGIETAGAYVESGYPGVEKRGERLRDTF